MDKVTENPCKIYLIRERNGSKIANGGESSPFMQMKQHSNIKI